MNSRACKNRGNREWKEELFVSEKFIVHNGIYSYNSLQTGVRKDNFKL